MAAPVVPLAVRAAAELELRRRRRAATPATRPPFNAWLRVARPDLQWDAPHFVAMHHVLDRVTAGEVLRFYCSLPIRHGKSESNTIGYPAYRFEDNPRLRVILASYNARKAAKFSRSLRRLVAARGVPLSDDRNASTEWETAAGGSCVAVGAGAGVAGENADLIVVDDPIGSRDEAESPAHRDRVWDWLTNDLLARCEPHTAVLLTMSRWHTDDPAGRLLDQQRDRWHVLDLPARAEPDDPLGRPEGAPLWPALRNAQWLDEKHAELGAYGFASLLQGRPRPREGGMFRWDWWGLLPEAPARLADNVVRYWDLAGTEPKGGRHDPDYSAGVAMARLPDARTALLHVARFRHSVGRRDAALLDVARDDLRRWGAHGVTWWIETEAGIAGEERTAALVRQLQALGLTVHTERPTGAKAVRAEPLASAAEAGNVALAPDDPTAPWRDAFRAEAADFPAGTHDDQVDAAAACYNKIAAQAASTWRVGRHAR